ncbi:acyl carrier protein [Nonomuraea sp. ATR24]|uniref:acyl carrier protein n=1 Tax=Nonomuraea TaxID=83681 RepID=UPI001C5E0D37|nr:acyl carrier protein [Nonomuraea ceibae]
MPKEEILLLIRRYCAEIFALDLADVTPDTAFDDLQADSMALIELHTALGRHELHVDLFDFRMSMTLAEAAELAHRAQPAPAP